MCTGDCLTLSPNLCTPVLSMPRQNHASLPSSFARRRTVHYHVVVCHNTLMIHSSMCATYLKGSQTKVLQLTLFSWVSSQIGMQAIEKTHVQRTKGWNLMSLGVGACGGACNNVSKTQSQVCLTSHAQNAHNGTTYAETPPRGTLSCNHCTA